MSLKLKNIIQLCLTILSFTLFLSACSHDVKKDIGIPQKKYNTVIQTPKTNIKFPNNPEQQEILVNKKYKIALFLPLHSQSVAIKQVAQSLLNAARLAQQEVNNKNMDLIIYPISDDDSTIVPAAQRAVADKIDLIIGPLLAPSVVTVRQYTEPVNIPMIAFSNDQTAVKGGVSYLLSYLPEQNIANIVNYAFMQGHKRFGLFASNTPYGKRVGNIFSQEVRTRHGNITNSVYFTENSPDFYQKINEISEVKARLVKTKPTSWTSILLPDRASLMMQTLPLFAKNDINFNKILILGTGLWDDPRIFEIEELNNAVFAAPNQKTLKIFENRYNVAYQEKPTTIASLAYDAVALASGLIRQYPNNPFAPENITNPNGFTGVGGIFRFRSDGLSERGLSILRIYNKKLNVVIPAPETFSRF